MIVRPKAFHDIFNWRYAMMQSIDGASLQLLLRDNFQESLRNIDTSLRHLRVKQTMARPKQILQSAMTGKLPLI